MCTEPGGDLVLMVKPQFEIGKDRLGRTGVVNSERERRMAVEKVANAALDAGLDLHGLAAVRCRARTETSNTSCG